MADFANGLDRINALAEASDGFVWRLVGDGNDATTLRPFGEDMLINMSVWRSLEALRAFVYKTDHRFFLARRTEWFLPMMTPLMALWWVPAGHVPTPDEAGAKLALLEKHGPTEAAFSFAQAFPAPL